MNAKIGKFPGLALLLAAGLLAALFAMGVFAPAGVQGADQPAAGMTGADLNPVYLGPCDNLGVNIGPQPVNAPAKPCVTVDPTGSYETAVEVTIEMVIDLGRPAGTLWPTGRIALDIDGFSIPKRNTIDRDNADGDNDETTGTKEGINMDLITPTVQTGNGSPRDLGLTVGSDLDGWSGWDGALLVLWFGQNHAAIENGDTVKLVFHRDFGFRVGNRARQQIQVSTFSGTEYAVLDTSAYRGVSSPYLNIRPEGYHRPVDLEVGFTTNVHLDDGDEYYDEFGVGGRTRNIKLTLGDEFMPGTGTYTMNPQDEHPSPVGLVEVRNVTTRETLDIERVSWGPANRGRGQELTIRLADPLPDNTNFSRNLIVRKDQELNIRINPGLGIMTKAPGATTSHTVHMATAGGMSSATVDIPFPPDMVQNFEVEVSPMSAGDAAQYTFSFDIDHPLMPGDTITAHFDKGFMGHGATLSKEHVIISAAHDTNATTDLANPMMTTGDHNPSLSMPRRLLSGENAGDVEYAIRVPDMNGPAVGSPGIGVGSRVTVIISPEAGIMNPDSGGLHGPLGVYTSEQPEMASAMVTIAGAPPPAISGLSLGVTPMSYDSAVALQLMFTAGRDLINETITLTLDDKFVFDRNVRGGTVQVNAGRPLPYNWDATEPQLNLTNVIATAGTVTIDVGANVGIMTSAAPLLGADTYSVSVAIGGDMETATVELAEASGAPGMPEDVQVSAPDGRLGELIVNWDEPGITGASAIESYTVTWTNTVDASDTGSVVIPAVAGVTSYTYTITGLANNQMYDVTVVVKNAQGLSSAGRDPSPDSTLDPDDADQARQWTPVLVVDDANAMITESMAGPFEVTGVTLDAYDLNVHQGTAVVPGGTVRPRDVLEFEVVNNPDFEITNENNWGFLALVYTGDGLDYESQDMVELVARVTDSDGNSSTEPITVMVMDALEQPAMPAMPMLERVAGSDDMLTLMWGMPETFGPDITGYAVRYMMAGADPDDPMSWMPSADGMMLDSRMLPLIAAELEYTIMGLTPGMEYQAQVMAMTHEGRSEWSASSMAMAPGIAPEMPGNVMVTVPDRRGELMVSWEAPAYDGSFAITEYMVYWYYDLAMMNLAGSGSVVVDQDATDMDLMYTIKNLAVAQTYYVAVSAKNMVDEGMKSALISAMTVGEPGLVQNMMLSASTTSVLASWHMPAENNGRMVTDYKVSYRIDDGDYMDPVSTNGALNHIIELPRDTLERIASVQVMAVNAVGDGSAVALSVQVPAVDAVELGAPGSPTRLILNAQTSTVQINWDPPATDGGSDITGYTVLYTLSGEQEMTHSDMTVSTSRVIHFAAADEARDITVKVMAVNAEGTGPATTAVVVVPPMLDPLTVPASPRELMLNASTTDVFVTWQAPESDGGEEITDYKVEYKLGAGDLYMLAGMTGGAQAHTIDVDTSTAERTITVKVMAVNALGDGIAAIGRTTIPAVAIIVDDRDELDSMLMATESDTPGDSVRVRLRFHAKEDLGLDDRIAVDFGSFGVPDTIDPDNVDLRVWGREGNTGQTGMAYAGHPSDVTTSGSLVTLILGSALQNSSAAPNSVSGLMMDDEVEVVFRESAGITNPTSAMTDESNFGISIDADRTKDRALDGDTYRDRNYGSVVRKVSVSPTSASRGSEIIIMGKGFSSGTATVFIDMDMDGIFDSDDPVLGQTLDIDNGSFELTTDVGGDFEAGSAGNIINAVDSSGNMASTENDAMMTVSSKIEADPETADIGETVTIKVSDWGKGSVDRVSFGGLSIMAADFDFNSTSTADSGELQIKVPNRARIGINKVTLYVNGESQGSVNVTVDVLELSVTPLESIPDQQITIRGSGFIRNTDVTDIKVGDQSVDDVPDDAKVDSRGNVSVTVNVPLDVGSGQKTVTLTAGGYTGVGSLEVAEPSIELRPQESIVGSTVRVTGSGFASNDRVQLEFAGEIEDVGRADGDGRVDLTFRVPSTAGIGTTNEVRVVSAKSDTIEATAEHQTPGPVLSVTEEARAGGTVIISGRHWAGFTIVSEVAIGSHDARPAPAPETDRDGSFEFAARVPRLSVGSHTVSVTIGDATRTVLFTVVDTPIITGPADMFADVIEAGKLTVVWRYDNPTATWASYAPGAPEALNDLIEVTEGDIVWVQVTEDVEFQGRLLYEGWNLITLN